MHGAGEGWKPRTPGSGARWIRGEQRPHRPLGHLPPRLSLGPAEARPWRCPPAAGEEGVVLPKHTDNQRKHPTPLCPPLGDLYGDPH